MTFQAENFIILKAIEIIAGGSGSDSESYMIFVDSQAAIRAIALVCCKSHDSKESLRTF